MAFLDELLSGGLLGQILAQQQQGDTTDIQDLSARGRLQPQAPAGLPPQIPAASPQTATATLPTQPQGASFLDRLATGLRNLGSDQQMLPSIANAIQGFNTGERTDPQGIAQQNLIATYNALSQRLPEPIARAATLNPDILKTIAPELVPKLQETGTDPLTGQKNFGIYQPFTKTLTEAPIQPAAGGDATQQTGTHKLLNSGLQGEDFLKSVESTPQFGKGVVNTIKLMTEGKIPPPTSFAMAKPYWQSMIQLAQQYDPTFDATQWAARVKTRSDFAAGGPNSVAGTITAGNTAIQHLGSMSTAADNLNNWGGVPIINHALNLLRNTYATESGNEQAGKIKEFNSFRDRFAEEATKFYRGMGGSEADIKRDIGTIDTASSPNELRKAIAAQAELMKSKVNALQSRWTQTMGPSAGEYPIIQPKSQNALDLISSKGGVTPQQTQSGTPQIGEVRRGFKFLGGDPSLQSSWQKQ